MSSPSLDDDADDDVGTSSSHEAGLSYFGACEFQFIPNEVALLIFHYLSLQDLLSLSQTCKHWNEIAQDDSLWRPLYHQRWDLSHVLRAPPNESDHEGSRLPPPPPCSSSAYASLLAKARGRWQRRRLETMKKKKQQQRRRMGSTMTTTAEESASPGATSGWRSWKSKYAARCNWLSGRVVWRATIDLHSRHEHESLTCLHLDEEQIAAGSTDGTIHVLSAANGRPLQRLVGHQRAVTCLQAEGHLMVTGSKDNTVRIWRGPPGDQECALTLAGHHGKITCLQISGHHLLTRSTDFTGNMWDMNTGQILHQVKGNSVCYSMHVDRCRLVCGNGNNSIKLWDLRIKKCLQSYYAHSDIVSAVKLEGNLIVSGSYDSTVHLVDARNNVGHARFSRHKGPVNALQFQDNRIVSASSDHTVRVWDAKRKEFLFELKGHNSPVNDVYLDDRKVASCDADGSIKLWNFAEAMSY